MQVFILFIVLSFVLGGIRPAHHVRRHPVLLLGLSFVAGVAFYSLRVVL